MTLWITLYCLIMLPGIALASAAPTCNCNAPGAIRGTNGPDTIRGTPNADIICGLRGNDTIMGRGGNDCIKGGRGNDTIMGGAGDDVIYSGRGNDELKGGADQDVLRGGRGRDTLRGQAGDDDLDGGKGLDDLVDKRGDNNCTDPTVTRLRCSSAPELECPCWTQEDLNDIVREAEEMAEWTILGCGSHDTLPWSEMDIREVQFFSPQVQLFAGNFDVSAGSECEVKVDDTGIIGTFPLTTITDPVIVALCREQIENACNQ